jgi:hypothetical protein
MAQYEVVVSDDTFQYEFLEPDDEVPVLANGQTVASYLDVIVSSALRASAAASAKCWHAPSNRLL